MDMAPIEPTEAELLRCAMAGDEEAFIALYGRWGTAVHRFALAMSGSRETAEDVAQEAFLILLSEGHRYDPARGPLGAYLRGIVRHQLRRRWRRDKRYVALPPEDKTPDVASAGESDLLANVARGHQVEATRRAVASLPAHYRDVVVLCDLTGLEYAEAARELGLPVGTVRSRLARARTLLARKLAPGSTPRGWRSLLWGWSL
jgi:RNA polymerase sigma-70 factor, ECF subfamily